MQLEAQESVRSVFSSNEVRVATKPLARSATTMADKPGLKHIYLAPHGLIKAPGKKFWPALQGFQSSDTKKGRLHYKYAAICDAQAHIADHKQAATTKQATAIAKRAAKIAMKMKKLRENQKRDPALNALAAQEGPPKAMKAMRTMMAMKALKAMKKKAMR